MLHYVYKKDKKYIFSLQELLNTVDQAYIKVSLLITHPKIIIMGAYIFLGEKLFECDKPQTPKNKFLKISQTETTKRLADICLFDLAM